MENRLPASELPNVSRHPEVFMVLEALMRKQPPAGAELPKLKTPIRPYRSQAAAEAPVPLEV